MPYDWQTYKLTSIPTDYVISNIIVQQYTPKNL